MLRLITIYLALTFALFTPSVFAHSANYDTAFQYTVRYIPRYQTGVGQESSTEKGMLNTLIAPIGMGPEYKAVVAINNDTIYTSAILNLTDGPQILTLPPYSYTYSIQQVDGFGTVLETGLSPSSVGGVYELVGPNYTGLPPQGVTQIKVPQNLTILAVRTDKYSNNDGVYTDVIAAANNFSASVQLQSLSAWTTNHNGGATTMEPLSYFSTPMKTMVDLTIQGATNEFFIAMQRIMASPSTSPLSKSDTALIDKFNKLYNSAKQDKTSRQFADLIEGARAGHKAVLAHWRSHTIGHNWVHFNNMGNWGNQFLDRAAGNEYIQFGNIKTAAYYAQAFKDHNMQILRGNDNKSYTITFAKNKIPTCTRFWSLTAYTPSDIELVENSANKYVVASYTPNLVTNSDGSITIYLSEVAPADSAKLPNWLPIPSTQFSVMLRVYGPTGNVEAGRYIPPFVKSN
jgi:hypothetical protein